MGGSGATTQGGGKKKKKNSRHDRPQSSAPVAAVMTRDRDERGKRPGNREVKVGRALSTPTVTTAARNAGRS